MRCEIEPENFTDLDCAVFEDNHPNAMALSVLVTIEMLNAVNSYVRYILTIFIFFNLQPFGESVDSGDAPVDKRVAVRRDRSLHVASLRYSLC